MRFYEKFVVMNQIKHQGTYVPFGESLGENATNTVGFEQLRGPNLEMSIKIKR